MPCHAIDARMIRSPSRPLPCRRRGHQSKRACQFQHIFCARLAILLSAGRGRTVQFVAGAAVALLLVDIGISRVKLGAHSIPEVLVGFTVGALALVA